MILQSSTATLVQQAVKRITCERCGHEYSYEMTRRAHASAADASSSGREAARVRAERKLERIVAREQDPVPCPECGYFQPAMTWTVRRHHLGWTRKLAIALIPITPVAGLVMLIVAGTEASYVAKVLNAVAIWTMPSGLVLALLLLLSRWLLARGIDLNAPGVDTSRWTDGAPRQLNAAGNAPVSSPNVAAMPEEDGGLGYAPHGQPWVRVQPLTWTSPPICCCCLKQNEATYQVYITQACHLKVNLCAACRRRLNLRRWAIAIVATGIPMVPLTWFFWPYLESIVAVLGVFMAVLGWMAYIVYRVTLPVRFRRFHDHDNTVEIRFRNASYMHELSTAERVRP